MPLNQEQLTEALHDALQAAKPPCTTFCRAGAEVTAEGVYRCWHNGTGGVTGDDQLIVADAPLAFSKETLSGRLQVWIEGQHRREHVDLNASMEIEARGPAMAGWPWRWADGTAA
jgi:hypothetical protein